MCDKNNKENITCETKKSKIDNFLSTLQYEIYTLSREVDINSNNPKKIEKNEDQIE